jgi:SAM-dependent methyltransferase
MTALVPHVRSIAVPIVNKVHETKAHYGRRKSTIDPAARRINFGAGPWFRPGWECADWYAPDVYIDYRIDFRTSQRLPLPDGCCELIFTSHTLEHVDDDVAAAMLGEAYRLLRPGGTLRVSVPDGSLALSAYRRGDDAFFDSGGVDCVGSHIGQKLVNFFASYRDDEYAGGPLVTPEAVRSALSSLSLEDFVDWCVARIPDGAPYRAHVNGYTPEKLMRMFGEAGFGSATRRSAYRGSHVAELRGPAFDNRPTVSLFVEATK